MRSWKRAFSSSLPRTGGGWRSDARAPARRCRLPDTGPTVAILPWGLLYDEDFLDPIGVSLEAFCTDMTGGYLFNYVEALQLAGLRPIIVVVIAKVREVTRLTHAGTGATVLALPPPRRLGPVRAVIDGRILRTLARFPPLSIMAAKLMANVTTPLGPLAHELRREQCAALLCQEYEYERFATCVALGRRLGVPVFATFQGGQSSGSLERRVRAPAIRQCAGLIIAPHAEIHRVRDCYGLPDEKIARVFNPVDPSSFHVKPQSEARARLGIPPDAGVAIWYGRVERDIKGLDVLVDAWERICRQSPGRDLRLLLIGTGMDADWLRRRLAEPGVRGVHWRDEYVNDRGVLRLHLSAANVFVFPSRREGFPLAPIEAMACGVPVVAAAAPGIADILEGGEAAGGFVVARGDVDQFAQALSTMLDDPVRAAEIGRAGRERAHACFSIEVVGRQLRDFMVRRGLRMEGIAA